MPQIFLGVAVNPDVELLIVVLRQLFVFPERSDADVAGPVEEDIGEAMSTEGTRDT